MLAWREDVRQIEYDVADSAGYYWVMNKANYEADRASSNVRRSFVLHTTSQQRPGQRFSYYENVSFRRVSCLINLPGHLDRDDPRLNGLVDRYHAHAYAQVLLLDQPVFPDASGVPQFLPEDYQVKADDERKGTSDTADHLDVDLPAGMQRYAIPMQGCAIDFIAQKGGDARAYTGSSGPYGYFSHGSSDIEIGYDTRDVSETPGKKLQTTAELALLEVLKLVRSIRFIPADDDE
ncbi:hypothetical protein NLI96_g13192 [Meripilus lineatus]|uniref:Uncharacterized protein n=1 Tax=Meripilus lineatus TaxID=2056292 RepID=A0AAD5UNG0_9APHY|nr:hypothetical protein NLI96_g13192 [Physisporinus lineatus]